MAENRWTNIGRKLTLAVIVISGVSSPIVISKGIEVMGLTERITGYTFYIWMFLLAYLLIKEQSAQVLSGL
jgi:hypothetical protein